jgi:hypothetical protein
MAMTPARKTAAAVVARSEANSSGDKSGTATIGGLSLRIDYHL